MRTEVESGTPLPEKGILFLGGHPNMTKKLRQQFPKWTFVSDEQLKKCSCANPAAVFYWTGHCSHKMMRYVYSKLPANASILYVTATNLPMLIAQMQQVYQEQFVQ